jgi:hypothetical protein
VEVIKEQTRSELKRGNHHQFFLIPNLKMVGYLDGLELLQ